MSIPASDLETAVLDLRLAAALEFVTGVHADRTAAAAPLAVEEWPEETAVWATVRLPAPVDARQWVVVPAPLAVLLVNRTWPGLPLEISMAAHLFGDLVANAVCVALAEADPTAPVCKNTGFAGYGPCPRPTGAVRAAHFSIEGHDVLLGLELDEPDLDALDWDWARDAAN